MCTIKKLLKNLFIYRREIVKLFVLSVLKYVLKWIKNITHIKQDTKLDVQFVNQRIQLPLSVNKVYWNLINFYYQINSNVKTVSSMFSSAHMWRH